MDVVPGKVILILVLSLSVQEVLSEEFQYAITNHFWYENLLEGFTIQLVSEQKQCELDLHFSSRYLIAPNTGWLSQKEVGKPIQHMGLDDIVSCHYIGKIVNISSSWVAATICRGIEGVLYDGISKYSMKSPEYHVNGTLENFGMISIENLVPDKEMNFNCGSYDDTFKEESGTVEKSRFDSDHIYKTSTYFVEMVMVVDWSFYAALSRNKTQVYARSQEIVNIVNAFYRHVHLFVTLVNIHIENEPGVITHTLEGFSDYASDFFDRYDNIDNIQLLTQKPITIQVNGTNVDIKGTARMGAMCERTGHGIIEDRMRKSDIYMTASTLSLALALNLNAVLNETDEGCYTRELPPSNCTFELLKDVLRTKSFMCMINKPRRLIPKEENVHSLALEIGLWFLWAILGILFASAFFFLIWMIYKAITFLCCEGGRAPPQVHEYVGMQARQTKRIAEIESIQMRVLGPIEEREYTAINIEEETNLEDAEHREDPETGLRKRKLRSQGSTESENAAINTEEERNLEDPEHRGDRGDRETGLRKRKLRSQGSTESENAAINTEEERNLEDPEHRGDLGTSSRKRKLPSQGSTESENAAVNMEEEKGTEDTRKRKKRSRRRKKRRKS